MKIFTVIVHLPKPAGWLEYQVVSDRPTEAVKEVMRVLGDAGLEQFEIKCHPQIGSTVLPKGTLKKPFRSDFRLTFTGRNVVLPQGRTKKEGA